MSGKERIARPTCLVMSVFLEHPEKEDLYGWEIAADAGLQHGTVYPILKRQTERGRLEHRRENVDPKKAARPARSYYRLTEEGRAFAMSIRIPLPDPEEEPAVIIQNGDLVEPDDPAAYALAQHIASYPASTVMAAFRYLDMKLTFDLIDAETGEKA